MMGMAFQIGIEPLTFWQLTPREFEVLVKAYHERNKRETEQQIVAAYLTAYWHRVKKMPSLKDVLGHKHTQKQKKTPEEMLEVVKRLNAAFGGTVLT